MGRRTPRSARTLRCLRLLLHCLPVLAPLAAGAQAAPAGASGWLELTAYLDGRAGRPSLEQWQENPGATDVSEAFRAVLADAAGSGRPVHLQAGVYAVGSYQVGSSSLVLVGDGPGKTVIRYRYAQQAGDPAGERSFLVFPDGARSVRIANLSVECTGPFDTGDSYTGKVHGLRFQGARDVYIEDVEVSGANHSGIRFDKGAQPSVNVNLTHCDLHHNRCAGLWYYDVDGLRVLDCELHHNGLASDPGTGYGAAASSAVGERSRNLLFRGNRVYCNRRKGLDFHQASDFTVEGNVVYGDVTSRGLGDQFVGIYAGEVQGRVRILNNRIFGFRDRGLGPKYVMAAIEVGWPQRGERLLEEPLNVSIAGNAISDWDVPGGADFATPILVHNDFTNVSGTIADNSLEADHVGFAVNLAESGTGQASWNSWSIRGNTLALTHHEASFVVRMFQVTSARFSGNRTRVTQSTSRQKAVVAVGPTRGSQQPLINILDNESILPDGWATEVGAHASETGRNFVNGVREPSTFYTGDSVRPGRLAVSFGSEMPRSGRYQKGDLVLRSPGEEERTAREERVIGWRRLTTGTSHVAGKDWEELRGSAAP